MTLRCPECDKPRLVFSKKKPTTKILIEFKKQTADLLFTCGMMVLKLVGNNKDMTENLQIRENLNCQMPAEKLYCSAGYEPCCCHCATKGKLVNTSNYYLICTFAITWVKSPFEKQVLQKRRDNKLFVFALLKKGQ